MTPCLAQNEEIVLLQNIDRILVQMYLLDEIYNTVSQRNIVCVYQNVI